MRKELGKGWWEKELREGSDSKNEGSDDIRGRKEEKKKWGRRIVRRYTRKEGREGNNEEGEY